MTIQQDFIEMRKTIQISVLNLKTSLIEILALADVFIS